MDLKRMNILAFMRKVYELHDCDHVFYNLGIQSAPSKTQVQCLATIPLTSAYSCFKFFFQWIDDGYYDFNDLPIIVKKSINPKDIETPIEEIDSQWDDSPAVLLKALQQLVDVLKDSEQDIKCATEISPDVRCSVVVLAIAKALTPVTVSVAMSISTVQSSATMYIGVMHTSL